MRLPNRENAYIPQSKLNDYLLSETHPVGSAKARVFSAAGFNRTNTSLLEQELIAVAHHQKIIDTISSPYGVKYLMEGTLQTPSGEPLQIRTVWIIETGQDSPRLVTAYPS